MNTKQAFELLAKQVSPQVDASTLFTPQAAFNAIALFAATGKRRAGTQGQAVLACYLNKKGAAHETIMQAFGIGADDTRMNLCHRLGPVNGKAGSQYLPNRVLAETVTSGKGATLHIKVALTDLGKAVIADAKPVKVTKAKPVKAPAEPVEAPQANEPVEADEREVETVD